jgi:transposase InsO family protein
MNRRIGALEPGAIITFDGDTWKVTGLDSVRIHLSPLGVGQPSVWLIEQVMNAADFRIVETQTTQTGEAQTHADQFTLDTLDKRSRQQVTRRMDIVLLTRDGRLPGQTPDPELDGLSQRARRDILTQRYQVSDSAIRGWQARFRDEGIAGLVDRRLTDAATPASSIDAKWREAFRQVMADYPDQSNVTDELLIERVRNQAAVLFKGELKARSDRQLRRYLHILAGSTKDKSGKAQRSIANVPERRLWDRPIRAARPGQIVAIDTNHLDVFALDAVNNTWQRVQLLLALDIFSRSIVGWRFTAWEPTSSDVKLLLRHIVSPKVADASWPSQGLWRYTGVPEQVVAGLLGTDPLLTCDEHRDLPIAGVPVIIPDELSLDHGKVYTSRDVRDGCDLLGVTLGFGRPYTPTDKAHVERVFGTINNDFCMRLPGYKGPDVFSRGAASFVEDGAFFTLDEIEERFAAWVAVVYQNTPHASLSHPGLPGVQLTPNQMIDQAMASSGFIPVLLDRDLHIELLNTVWRRVSNEGIRMNNLSYDFPGASFLDDYRNRPGPHGGRRNTKGENLWRVKVDARDLSGVWFFAYTNPLKPQPGQGRWERVPLRDLPDAVPFQGRHLMHAKRVLVKRGGDAGDRTSLARELRGLLARIAGLPTDDLTREEKRVAAHAHAQQVAASPRRGKPTWLPVDDDEDYYTGPDNDDDVNETHVSHTSTRQPRPPAPSDTSRAAIALPMDDVEEWDPYGDDQPDIA